MKNNHARLHEYLKGLFEMNVKPMIKGAPQVELGHGIIESRSIRILAGSKLPETMHKHWIGLEEGCLIEVRKEIEIKKTSQRSVEFRYYFSSIPFEDYDVDKQKSLLNLFENYIRQH